MMDIAAVLIRIRPGTAWTLNGDEYDGLDWQDESPKPTLAELESAWPQVMYERDYKMVERERQYAYARDADPLFFKWQRGTGTEQEWLDAVQAVKDAHPYPEATIPPISEQGED